MPMNKPLSAYGFFTICLVFCMTLAPALASDNTTEIHDLGEVVISGGLAPISQQAYGRAFSVITSTEIEERGLRTVQDALRALPGVAVSSSGASNTQIRIRGGEGNHTLVLIDGIPARGGDGEYFFSGLETANIQRIEVLRGPQSVFYGSDASSGVINIITDQGVAAAAATIQPWQWMLETELGNGWQSSGRVTRQGERGFLSAATASRDDEGYDHAGHGGEKDGIRRDSISLAGEYQTTDWLRSGFLLRNSEESFDFDRENYSATSQHDYVLNASGYVTNRDDDAVALHAVISSMDGALEHGPRWSQTKYRDVTTTTSVSTTRHETETMQYRFTYGIGHVAPSAAGQTVALLLEQNEDRNTMVATQHRQTDSLALEYRGSFASGLDLQLGLRRDDNTKFKDATTWSGGVSRVFSGSGLRLHASAGSGVVHPSFAEVYGNTAWGITGNAALKPEKNLSLDAGVEIPLLGDSLVVDITLFRENLKDEITYVSGQTPNYYNQTGTSRRKGVEASAMMVVTDNTDLELQYTHLAAENPDGSVEVRRPRNTLGLGLRHGLMAGRAQLTGSLRHVSENKDSQFWGAYETKELPNYTVVDIAGDYALTDKVMLTGRVNNLFDNSYSDVWGYTNSGMNAFIGLRVRQ